MVEEENFESYDSQNRIRDILHNSDTNTESIFISPNDFNILKQQYEIITNSSIEPSMQVKKVADPALVEQQKKEYEQWAEQQHKARVQKLDAETQFILSYDKKHPRPELPLHVKQYFQEYDQQMYSFSVDPKMDKISKEHESLHLSLHKQREQAIKQFNSSYDTQHPLPETPPSVKKYLEQKERELVQERMKREQERMKWDQIDRERIQRGDQEQWYYG
jgi:hypothetical protein